MLKEWIVYTTRGAIRASAESAVLAWDQVENTGYTVVSVAPAISQFYEEGLVC